MIIVRSLARLPSGLCLFGGHSLALEARAAERASERANERKSANIGGKLGRRRDAAPERARERERKRRRPSISFGLPIARVIEFQPPARAARAGQCDSSTAAAAATGGPNHALFPSSRRWLAPFVSLVVSRPPKSNCEPIKTSVGRPSARHLLDSSERNLFYERRAPLTRGQSSSWPQEF